MSDLYDGCDRDAFGPSLMPPSKNALFCMMWQVRLFYAEADGIGSSNVVDKVAVGSPQTTDLHDMQGIEDTSILEDVAEAEEEYDRPEQVPYVPTSCIPCSEQSNGCVILGHCLRALHGLTKSSKGCLSSVRAH